MITSPIASLRTVEDNRVICVRFRDPKYPKDFVFPSTRLEGARDPPKVLKPGEYNGTESQRGRGGYRGGGGGGRGGDYRPNMGFGPRQDQASLGQAGHRMLSHHVPPAPMGGAYSSVPPPLMMGQPEGGYPSQRSRGYGFSRGDAHGRGGGGNPHRGGGGYGNNYGDNNYRNYGGGHQDRQSGQDYGGRQHQQQRGGHQSNWGGQQRGGYQGSRGGQWSSGGQSRGSGQNSRGGNRGGYGGYFTSGYQ